MKKLSILLIFLVVPFVYAGARDFRISDNDGDVLNINSDGTIPITGGGGTTFDNTTAVDCDDDIQTAIDAATAGDVLALGPCDYAVTGLTVDKALSIISPSGPYKTQITDSSGGATLYVTADDFHLDGVGFVVTSGDASIVHVDCTGGTTCQNISMKNFYINGTSAANSGIGGFRCEDCSFEMEDGIIELSSTMDGTDQSRGIWKMIESTNEADTTCSVKNVRSVLNANGSSSNAISRAVYVWNNGADQSSQTQTCEFQDVVAITIPADTDDQTEAFIVQGATTIAYVYNGFIDGVYTGTAGIFNQNNDIRIDDSGEANFYGTYFGRGTQNGSGTINKNGFLGGYGIVGTAPPQAPTTAAPSSVGRDVFTLTGQQGGDNSDTDATESGSAGADAVITLGSGGQATGATGTGTAGAGGGFTLTAGAGGAQSDATPPNNVGGKGGSFTLTAGDGGAATNGATTNTGGGGGDLYLLPGSGGTGATANGDAGNLLLATDSSGTTYGQVLLGLTNDDYSISPTTTVLNASPFIEIKRASAVATTVPSVVLGRSRGSTSSPTIAVDEDYLGSVSFYGYDGDTWESTAAIIATADDTVSDGNMPTRLEFFTGTVATRVSRMRLLDDGRIMLGISGTSLGTDGQVSIDNGFAPSSPTYLYIATLDTSIAVNQDIGGIKFLGNDSDLSTQKVFATIIGESEANIGSDAASGRILFQTTGTGAGGSPVSRATIDAYGAFNMFTGGIVPDKVTADPCGDANAYPEGSIFYNDTSNYMCYCDGTNDVQVHAPASGCF